MTQRLDTSDLGREAEANHLGRYKLLQKIGEGGMAAVFRAEMQSIGGFSKIVALKVIHQQLARRSDFSNAFISEARLGGYFSHPNIVQTLDFGKLKGRLFLAMEFVEGPTLGQVISACSIMQEPLPLDLTLRIMADICRGLHFAHAATDHQGRPLRIVHRDLKPSNVLIGLHGQVKVADFGVARAESNLVQTLHTGVIKGTVRYMSPEQAWGQRNIDLRSDLFALGLILYELLTLTPIYPGQQTERLLRAAQDADVLPRLEQLPDNGLQEPLRQLLTRMLSREPAGRPGNAGEVGAELERMLDEMPRRSRLEDWIGRLWTIAQQAQADEEHTPATTRIEGQENASLLELDEENDAGFSWMEQQDVSRKSGRSVAPVSSRKSVEPASVSASGASQTVGGESGEPVAIGQAPSRRSIAELTGGVGLFLLVVLLIAGGGQKVASPSSGVEASLPTAGGASSEAPGPLSSTLAARKTDKDLTPAPPLVVPTPRVPPSSLDERPQPPIRLRLNGSACRGQARRELALAMRPVAPPQASAERMIQKKPALVPMPGLTHASWQSPQPDRRAPPQTRQPRRILSQDVSPLATDCCFSTPVRRPHWFWMAFL